MTAHLRNNRPRPSPYGDFVFQPARNVMYKKAQYMFPSPYGDFVFQQKTQIMGLLYKRAKCFRPLTGILFFNAYSALLYVTFRDAVSVPLRGFCFSTKQSSVDSIWSGMFPSPYGDFVFQRKEDVIMKEKKAYCFRPLTGILFFNSPSEKPCHS